MLKTKYEIYYSSVNEFDNINLKIDRMDRALSVKPGVLPDSKVIHIAGTNGKGSTSLFIAEMLEENGYSTMLFTSPHIHSVTERIQYRLQNIPFDEFNELFDEAFDLISGEKLSFFEGIFLIFMLAASKKKPDFIILETGLGGSLDATNCLFIKNKIPVITTIAQDHKQILGNKILAILKDKLGIVRQSGILFVGKNEEFINDYIRTNHQNIRCCFLDETDLEKALKIYNRPFVYNYLNARNVVNHLLDKTLEVKKYPLPMCRQEWFGNVLIDGAHNPSGMFSLINSTEGFDAAVMSATTERELDKLIKIAQKKIPRIFLTVIPDNTRSKTLAQLHEIAESTEGCLVFENPVRALEEACKVGCGRVLVAGSLYLCAYIRAHMAERHA